MLRRVYSAWSRCALVVAAAGSLALVSLTARSQTASPRQPSVASRSEAARKAQHRCVSAEYIDWLKHQSMLDQSQRLMPLVSGQGLQWRHEYAVPQTRAVLQKASVWVLGYPRSAITRPDQSVLETWGDPALWEAFKEIGIDLLHTGPVKRSGGIVRKEHTPTVDGRFWRFC